MITYFERTGNGRQKGLPGTLPGDLFGQVRKVDTLDTTTVVMDVVFSSYLPIRRDVDACLSLIKNGLEGAPIKYFFDVVR
jgi:hypothetical protein